MGFHKGNNFSGGRRDSNQGRNGGGRNFDRPKFGGRSNYGQSESYPATCNECSASFELPFRPKGDRPVFCNNCFRNNKDEYERKGGFSKNTVDHEKEYAQINRKLDKIMKLYEFIADEKKEEKIPAKKVVAKKPVEKTAEEEVAEMEEKPVVKKPRKAAVKKTATKKDEE